MRLTLITVGLLVALSTLGCMLSGTLPDAGAADSGSTALSCTPGGAPCKGCCSGSTCKEGRLATECGVEGEACSQCPPDTVCWSFTGCGVDPKSRWKVTPVGATITPPAVAWDPDGGLPDVYADVFCPDDALVATATTNTAYDTLDAVWGRDIAGACVMEARTLQTRGFAVAVRDDDGRPIADTITMTSVVKVNEADFKRGYMMASGPNLESIYFLLEKQP